ncbi:MAG: precorrin-2 C(20)-methyltransferase [Candidatus Omnitrophota bacterium]
MASGKLPRGKLYGIGVGPGDPGLISIKARRILRAVDIIFTPCASGDGLSYARSIIEGIIGSSPKVVRLVFPMTRDKVRLRQGWRRAGQRIFRELNKGLSAAFVTIGDPFIYSTYIYLFDALQKDFPAVCVETVPGISSFNAAAARANVSLARGEERLAILPLPDNIEDLDGILSAFDTVVLMKLGAGIDRVINYLRRRRLLRNAILVSRVGRPDEHILRNLSFLKNKKAGYLSVIIIKSLKRNEAAKTR